MGDCEKDLDLDLVLNPQQEENKEEEEEEEVVVTKETGSSSSANGTDHHDPVTIETPNGDLQSLDGNDRQGDDNPEADSTRSVETLDGELKDETLDGELKDLSLEGNGQEQQQQQQEDDKSEEEGSESLETLGGKLQNLSLLDDATDHQQVNPEADPESTKTLDGELQNLSVEENGHQEDSPEADPDSIEIIDGELENTILEGSSKENQDDNPEAQGDSAASSTETLDGELQNTSSERNEEDQRGSLEGGETTFKEENKRKFQYPLRPGEPACAFYLRTRMCHYGSHCRFNHPLIRKKQVQPASHLPESVQADKEEKEKVESTERDGQQGYEVVNEKEKEKDNDREKYSESTRPPICKYYLSGSCMYGRACKNHHPREKTIVVPAKEFNFLGLPIRPGERECPFFMRTGSCKYATNCRFHHPDPTDAGGSESPSEYQNGGSVMLQKSGSSQPPIPPWSLPGISNGTAPYMDASASYTTVMSLPTQVVHQNLEWSGYQVPVSPVYPSQGNTSQRFAPAMNSSPRKGDDSMMHHQQRMAVDEFPERPGQLECQYFMKTGDCKYRSGCKFHHPKNRSTNSSVHRRNSLPHRPDQVICVHYSRHGTCKYGPACKFNHPTSVL